MLSARIAPPAGGLIGYIELPPRPTPRQEESPLLKLRHLVEYGLLRSFVAVLDRLPHAAAGWLVGRLAHLWFVVDRGRRRVARDNILRSGIESEPKRALDLALRSAQHMGLVAIESLKSAKLLEGGRWREHVTLRLEPDVEAVLNDPEQGLIMVSGHFGNWELAAQLLSRYKPVAGITRPMNNPRVEAFVRQRKPRYRFRTIPKSASDPHRLLTVLKDKQILALLTDQHARAGGMRVDFFGHPASTYTTAAMLHLVTRAPLCFAACRRTAPLHFELFSSPLIRHEPTGKKQDDVRHILETINHHLEVAIRSAPDQYLWGHRRWRDA